MLAVLAVLFAAYLLYAAGVKYLLPAAIVYAPGAVLFFVAQREHGRRVLNRGEAVMFAVLTVAAVVGLVLLLTGTMTL